MFTIIHGSHRHGYHWKVTELLKEALETIGVKVNVIDLSQIEFEYCCGDQVCQTDDCLYKEDNLSILLKKFILPARGIYIVSPTYFNMPPAKLKSFIDRTNALLPAIEKKPMNTIFGAWVSGEADQESVGCHSKLLCDYAEIMGWKVIEESNEELWLSDNKEIDGNRIKEIANIIQKNMF